MYSEAQKQHAIKLRLAGRSYGEIRKALSVKSKGTLSVWFKNIKLTPRAKLLLKSNMLKASKKKLLIFNTARSARIKEENAHARSNGRLKIGRLSERDLLIIGAALYWGEGTKSEGKRPYNPLAFSNSDATMIRLYLRFLREILKVPNEKIWGGIHIYKSIDESEARKFWAKCTGLPANRFNVNYQVSRASKGKRNTLPYGTISIRVHSRVLFQTVKGMIGALANEN